MSIDLEWSASGESAGNPGAMPVPDRVTAKVMVKSCDEPASASRIDSLQRSLMIEWE